MSRLNSTAAPAAEAAKSRPAKALQTEETIEGTAQARSAQPRAAWTAAVGEAKQSARLTVEQLRRALGLGRSYWEKRLQERQAEVAESRLGQRLYDAGWGERGLRAQVEQLQQKIANLRAAKKSPRGAEVELRGVYLRLAEEVLDAPPPPQAAEEHRQAVTERERLRQREEDVARQRAQLVPADRTSRLRVAGGLAVVAIGLFVAFSVVGPLVGFGPDLGPRAGELVDTWAGKVEFKMFGVEQNTDYTLQFRRDGRVKWDVLTKDNMGIADMQKKMYSGTDEDSGGTGSWHVERVEGNVFIVRVMNDLNPIEEDAYGWRIKFADSDHFTITGFEDMPVKFTRQ